MHVKSLIVLGSLVLVLAGCKSMDGKPSADAKWYDGVAGATYKGVVGGNSDPIIFKFAKDGDALVATYTIDDKAFAQQPYKGKLLKAAETDKPLTLKARYEDDMNNGSYQITFSKDLKTLTGVYVIDGEGESPANTVSATRQ